MSEELNKKVLSMTMNGEMEMKPASLTEMQTFADLLMQSQAVPNWFDTRVKLMGAIQKCLALGINPVIGISKMYYVNGTLAVMSELLLKKVLASGLAQDYNEILIDKEYKTISLANKNLDKEPWAAVVTSRRHSTAVTRESYFTMDDAERAKLSTNPKRDVWQKYQGRMLTHRARSAHLLDNYSDIVGGVEIVEFQPEERDVTQQNKLNGSSQIMKELLNEEVVVPIITN
jgi:hypothetical protein